MAFHYNDVILSTMASQIISLTINYSTVYSDANQRKHQSSASLAFVRVIHRWPGISPQKGPETRKMLSLDDVIMLWGDSACHLWFPSHKTCGAELWCFLCCKRAWAFEQTIEFMAVIWDAITLMCRQFDASANYTSNYSSVCDGGPRKLSSEGYLSNDTNPRQVVYRTGGA